MQKWLYIQSDIYCGMETCTRTFHPPPLHCPLPLWFWLHGKSMDFCSQHVSFLVGLPFWTLRDLEQLVCVPVLLCFGMMKIDFPPFVRYSLWVSLSPYNLCRLWHQWREKGWGGMFGTLNTQHQGPREVL